MKAFKANLLYACYLFSSIQLSYAQIPGPQNYSDFNLVVSNNSLYALGSLSPNFEIWALDLSQSFSAQAAPWQLRVNGSEYSSLLLPYSDGVAYASSDGVIFAEAGQGGTNQLATGLVSYNLTNNNIGVVSAIGNHGSVRMSMTANVDPNNVAWYFGGRTTNSAGETVYLNDLTAYEIDDHYWEQQFLAGPQNIQPGYRAGHTASLIDQKLFVFGGVGAVENTTTQAFMPYFPDFSTVLVFNLTLGDSRVANYTTSAQSGSFPEPRLKNSMVDAPDGHSLAMFGGFSTTNTSIIYDDIWVVDTCSLSWEKKTISGTAPVGRAGHSAVRVGNYMIIVGGFTQILNSQQELYANDLAILDMSQWAWVSSFTTSTTQNAQPTPLCSFSFSPGVGETGDSPINPQAPVIVGGSSNSDEAKKLGFGISFSTVAFLAILGGGIYFLYRRRRRSKSSIPYWLPGMGNEPSSAGHDIGIYPPADHSRTTDYPMFVYDPEGDKKKGEIALPAEDSNTRTYTASDDVEEWRAKEEERRPSNGKALPQHSSLWNKVRGLGTNSSGQDDEASLIKGADKNGWQRLEDYED
ncbi:Host cell factor 2 [Umbelopsis sp. WA50703]